MGLAASQGRMLLLTARKSDLEFRAQQISQKRLILSQQLEDISTEYEEATSNRQMKIRMYDDTGDGAKTAVTQNLTYAALVSGSVARGFLNKNTSAGTDDMTAATTTPYRLVDADGYIVVTDPNEIPGYVEGTTKIGKDGSVWIKKDDGSDEKYIIDKALKPSGSTVVNGVQDGPNYLQECLREGKYLIQQFKPIPDGVDDEGKPKNKETWSNVGWDAMSCISDSYYQDDDDAAKSKYDRLQSQVQHLDKKLELELDNVETQRKAVQTEIDSVDKVIGDNVEKTFNAFG